MPVWSGPEWDDRLYFALYASGGVAGCPFRQKSEHACVMYSADSLAFQADIWAMGCVLVELATAKLEWDLWHANPALRPKAFESFPDNKDSFKRAITMCLENGAPDPQV